MGGMLLVFVHVTKKEKCEQITLAVNIDYLRRVEQGWGKDMLSRWQSWDCNSGPFCSVLSAHGLPLQVSALCFTLFSVSIFPHYKINSLPNIRYPLGDGSSIPHPLLTNVGNIFQPNYTWFFCKHFVGFYTPCFIISTQNLHLTPTLSPSLPKNHVYSSRSNQNLEQLQ